MEGSCVAVGRNGCGDAALVFNPVSSKHHGGYLCHMSIAVSNVPFLGGGGDIQSAKLAVYTTYIPLIYCQWGDDMLPIPPIKGTLKLHSLCVSTLKKKIHIHTHL